MAENRPSRTDLDSNESRSGYKSLNDYILDLEKQRAKAIIDFRKDLEKTLSKELEKYEKRNKKQDYKYELAERKSLEKKLAKERLDMEAEMRESILQSSIRDIQEAYKAKNGEDLKWYQALGEKFKAASGLDALGKSGEKLDLKSALLQTEQIMSANLSKVMNTIGKKVDESIDSAMDTYSQYQGKLNARLVGTEKTFKGLMDRNSKMSPFYKTSEYIQNLAQLTDAGIAYNLEQRAFLSTISDKLVTTFEAQNQSLLRLVRIQQSDSTAARMGMEASLTEYLNQMYMNTEYLSTSFDTVTSNLMEAMSTMTAEQSVAFEYSVQKWLGALSSVGLSEGAISSLSQAIGQLGSGDVSSLIGTGMGNLLAMAVSRTGTLSYADILKGGLDVNQTEQLMSSLVSYMQEIASTSNKVVQSQLAQVFGLSLSDVIAAKNISPTSVGGILSYQQALGTLSSRMESDFSLGRIMSGQGALTIAEYMSNMIDNAMFSIGSSIADNAVQYGAYKIGGILQGVTSDLKGLPVADIINKVGAGMRIGSLASAGIENLIDVLKGTSLGINLQDIYNSLGDNYLGKATRGTSYSSSYTHGSSGLTITSGILGGTDIDTLKIEAEEDTEYQKQLNEAPLDIKNYLMNTLDNKLDTMIKLQAASANYSIYDTYGSKWSDTIQGIVGGTNVTIMAEGVDSSEITQSIQQNVANIYSLLQQVVSGQASLHVIDSSNTAGAAMRAVNVVSNYIGG